MSQHMPRSVHTWVVPEGPLQYTLTACDECNTFKIEAFYPDGENHGDVRYFNEHFQEPPPNRPACPGLA